MVGEGCPDLPVVYSRRRGEPKRQPADVVPAAVGRRSYFALGAGHH